MVLLTMTPSIVAGLEKIGKLPASKDGTGEKRPSISEPFVGKPIAHSQVVDLWQALNAKSAQSRLEELLRGSSVYIPPPPPKQEPSDEYKALMARLRRDEEARAYERMINPPKLESFSQRFPNSTRTFAEANRPTNAADMGDDDVTLNEVHRQVMLIINFLVSIVGVGATLWVLARWWPLPARIFLTMGGCILVAIAEVVVYNSFIWRMGQAREKDTAAKETKEIMNTWVVNQGEQDDADSIPVPEKQTGSETTVRRRNQAAQSTSDKP